jgi:hypothetical protein
MMMMMMTLKLGDCDGSGGYIITIEEERIPRKVLNGKFDKIKSAGKPRGMHYRSQE